MPRKIIIPPADAKMCDLPGGWVMYRHHSPTAKNSPLWPVIKIIQVQAATTGRHRRGRVRAVWLYWGIDECRFRFSAHQRRLLAEQPTVYDAAVRACTRLLRAEHVEAELGREQLEAERRRLAVSRARHQEEDRRRDEARRRALDDLM